MLGARLLWWCAAVRAPTGFGYSIPFSQALWCQPIWVTDDSRGARSNDRPITLMKQAASDVCRILGSQPEAKPAEEMPAKPEMLLHGPSLNGDFHWHGKRVPLTPTPWGLVDYLWNRPLRRASYSNAKQVVWGGYVKDSTIESAAYRATKCFKKAKVPLRVGIKKKQKLVFLEEVKESEEQAD